MRTVEQFVKSMVREGRSLKQIRAVAQCSRWASQMSEVLKTAKLFFNKKIKLVRFSFKRKGKHGKA